MKIISAELHAKADGIEAQLDELRQQIEDSANAEPETDPVAENPQVKDATQRLAQAVASALGIDLPLQPGGTSLPVVRLPKELAQSGGIGIAVIVAEPPTE